MTHGSVSPQKRARHAASAASDPSRRAEQCDRVSSEPRRYRVELTDRATIVARGERLEVWWVRVNDAWVRVADQPEAALGSADGGTGDLEIASDDSAHCPSGTVWERRFQLALPGGTQLLQRQSWPRVRELSVMDFLQRGLVHTQRVVQERRFVLTGNHKLTPIGRAELRSEAEPRASGASDGAQAHRAHSARPRSAQSHLGSRRPK